MSTTLIEALGDSAGVTIRVRHELPEHSMRLLDTLGARVEIDQSAPECVRFAGPYAKSLKRGGCARCRALDPAVSSLGEVASAVPDEAAQPAASPSLARAQEEAA